jgi:uncharacterized protein with von Willebrand factor type A (vWA) domain
VLWIFRTNVPENLGTNVPKIVFSDFFNSLRDRGRPVRPTAFLTLHRAMAAGLVGSLDDFYTAARAILVKSERFFDLFDRVFAHRFEGADLLDPTGLEVDEIARSLLEMWLERPEEASRLLGVDARALPQAAADRRARPARAGNSLRSGRRRRYGALRAHGAAREDLREERSGKPSVNCLRFLAHTFPHSAWLNPKPAHMWPYTRSVAAIRKIFQLYKLTHDGLEQAAPI